MKKVISSILAGCFMAMGLFFLSPIRDASHIVLTSILFSIVGHFTFPGILRFGTQKLLSTIHFESISDELIIHQTGASHFKRWEAVGGKLFLTTRKLVFKSHKLNIQNHEEEFDPLQIEKTENPNGKRFNFEYQGKLEKFIVDSPKEWVKQLESFKSP